MDLLLRIAQVIVPFTGPARAQLILFGALPPAVMQFLLAERYGQERVAAMILLGNALAVLFIPLGLALALPGQ